MTSEAQKCNWPQCGCTGVRGDPCLKFEGARVSLAMNADVARQITDMRYQAALEKFRAALDELHAAALGEDPFIYTACVRGAMEAVCLSMKNVRGAVLAWAEENPSADLHLHSFSGVYNLVPDGYAACCCDKCIEKRVEALAALHKYGEVEIKRFREHQFVVKAHLESPVAEAHIQ